MAHEISRMRPNALTFGRPVAFDSLAEGRRRKSTAHCRTRIQTRVRETSRALATQKSDPASPNSTTFRSIGKKARLGRTRPISPKGAWARMTSWQGQPFPEKMGSLRVPSTQRRRTISDIRETQAGRLEIPIATMRRASRCQRLPTLGHHPISLELCAPSHRANAFRSTAILGPTGKHVCRMITPGALTGRYRC